MKIQLYIQLYCIASNAVWYCIRNYTSCSVMHKTSCIVLYQIQLCCTLSNTVILTQIQLFCTVRYYIRLYCIVSNTFVLYQIQLYFTVWYYIQLYCIVSNTVVFYCTKLYTSIYSRIVWCSCSQQRTSASEDLL